MARFKCAQWAATWWDAGTLADLVAWKVERGEQGATGTAAFVCSVQAHRRGEAFLRHAIRLRFLSACKVHGMGRIQTLTIHHGRTRSSRTPWQEAARWRKCGRPRGTPTSP